MRFETEIVHTSHISYCFKSSFMFPISNDCFQILFFPLRSFPIDYVCFQRFQCFQSSLFPMFFQTTQGQSMFGTSNFGTEITSAPSSIEMLTSAACKRITLAEVNKNFQNLWRSSCAEVNPYRSSFTRLLITPFIHLSRATRLTFKDQSLILESLTCL